MPHHLEIFGDSVAAMHVARVAGNLERLAAIVALHHGNHFRCGGVVFHQPSDPQRPLQAQRDLGLHIGQFLLEKLGLGDWAVELFAIQPVLPRGVPAGLGRAHDAPADPVTRAVQAAERPLEALNIGQQGIFADFNAVHDNFAGDRGAQGQFAADFRRA